MIKNPTTDIYINQQLQKRYKVNRNYDNIFQDSVSGSVCHAMTWISHKIQVMACESDQTVLMCSKGHLW